MNPLTREEVMAWPAIGPMALKAERVLALIERAEAAECRLDIAIEAELFAKAELRKFTDDRELLAKDLEAARAQRDQARAYAADWENKARECAITQNAAMAERDTAREQYARVTEKFTELAQLALDQEHFNRRLVKETSEAELTLSTERARVGMLKAALLKMRDLVVRLIGLTERFSGDPMADSSIRADLQRNAAEITSAVLSPSSDADAWLVLHDQHVVVEAYKLVTEALRAGDPMPGEHLREALREHDEKTRAAAVGHRTAEKHTPPLATAECASCGEEGFCWSDGVVWTCVACSPPDGHPLADAMESNDGPMGTQPEGNPKGPVKP